MTTTIPSASTPENSAPPQLPLTLVGKLITGVTVLILGAGTVLAAFFGVPIPFTGYTLHHVGLSIVLGCVPAATFFMVARTLCGIASLPMERDPNADPFPAATTLD